MARTLDLQGRWHDGPPTQIPDGCTVKADGLVVTPGTKKLPDAQVYEIVDATPLLGTPNPEPSAPPPPPDPTPDE